ncbi:hypothetical protein Sste5346_006319 [Sporothrix stenoceras]|uniref:Uncharacterized protein n=1 Tax=Sporothrix stenoceras TaxID=5173 RepID=A0ABR3YYP9_9PEZI
MGAVSNDPKKLAYYAGFYKSIHAAGAARIKDTEQTDSDFEDTIGVDVKKDIDNVVEGDSATKQGFPETLPNTGPMCVIGMTSEAAEMGDAEVKN